MVWLKSVNSSSYQHFIYDTARGATNYIKPQNVEAEVTGLTQGLSAFGGDGFTVGTNVNHNASGTIYAAFSWLERVGYLDVVTYTGDGLNGKTITHNLGVTPEFIITKIRSTTGAWPVHHVSNGFNQNIRLNSSDASSADTTLYQAAGTSNYTIGDSTIINDSGETYVAYVFAPSSGLSDFGTYAGDGGSSNAITGIGFSPTILLIKGSDNGNGWRLVYNDSGTLKYLTPNSTAAAVTATSSISFDGDGFTLLDDDPSFNGSGNNYIYSAWR